jgi:flagellar basal-body rod protein FlgF
MDRLIYTTLSGMRTSLEHQAVTAHNIANVSTPGFQRDIRMRSTAKLAGQTFESRLQATSHVNGTDTTAGQIMPTGRALDVSFGENIYLAVQAPDGREAYTRRGDLRASKTGLLETGDGYSVVGLAGPITVPTAGNIEIGSDGTVSVQPVGASATARITIGRLKLVHAMADDVQKDRNGLLNSVSDEPLPADSTARLTSGTLENSNVNMAVSLVDLLEEARRYELQVKLLTTAKELDQSSTSLLQLQN